jgi:FMN phosphatase YigB (HAD superfamily)
MKKVEEASAHFCLLHMKHVSLEYASEFNRMYYQKYGHTVNMLRHLTGADVSLKEFNDFVYNQFIDYKQIESVLTPDDREHAKKIGAFIARIRKDGGVCEVFTNGSPTWVQRINEMVGMNEDVVDRPLFSNCENLPDLKPSPKAYKYVETRLQKIGAPTPYHFIDDSRRNLVYCEKTNTHASNASPTWIPILYENNDTVFEFL